MLAVVKAPPTQSTEGADFKIEGAYIPEAVMGVLRYMFPGNLFEEGVEDDEPVRLKDTEWYRAMEKRMTVGSKIRANRDIRGWTQKDLAEKLEIPVQNVSGMERNVRPVSRRMAAKLGEAFGTDPAAFFSFG